jgi:hypothetical protein
VPVGYVGDIEFWAPNRGLLITAGNGIRGATPVVPEGLYAYNGVDWHQLSTVCGGSDGRVAWAGPDEFWTIADQRPGSAVTTTNGLSSLYDVSLCHVLNGQVVGSYALPLDEPTSYPYMNAAACDSPSDCWFGGVFADQASNTQYPLYLHWDGSAVVVVDSPEDHEPGWMSLDGGQIYESVQIQTGDQYLPSEDPSDPALMKLMVPTHPDPFVDLYPTNTQCSAAPFCPPLPNYTPPDQADGFGALALSSDWSSGASDPQLWGVAAGTPGDNIVLFEQDGAWTQLNPAFPRYGSSGTLPLGHDANAPANPTGATVPENLAADPGEQSAWVSMTTHDGEGLVDRVTSTGAVTDADVLGGPQGIGPRGEISALACPAAHDCWAATDQGWLFHLTDGTQLPADTDPNFAGVITYRPPDAGTPQLPPPSAAQPAATPPTIATAPPAKPPVVRRPRRAKPVVEKFGKAKLEGPKHNVLVLTFTVTARARVQILGERHGKIVARSADAVLMPGRRSLSMQLDTHAWPTKLAVKAHPAPKSGKKSATHG